MEHKKESFHLSNQELTEMSLMVAVLCILSPIVFPLPFSPVPISLGMFAVYITIFVLGQKKSLICLCIYMLLGMVGLPVFSGFSAGIGKVVGSTGGYLIGYFLLAWVSGWFLEKYDGNRKMQCTGFVLGTLFCYAVGTAWLAFQTNSSLYQALFMGVIPFLPADCIKLILAFFVGSELRKRIPSLHNTTQNI